MNSLVCIAATGARTAIGNRCADSAAAVRAGISAATRQLIFDDRPWTLRSVARVPGLDDRLSWPKRLLALALPALQEACVPLVISAAEEQRCALHLSFPEPRPGFDEAAVRTVCDELRHAEGLPRFSAIVPYLQGHAGGFSALAAGAASIRAGELESCVVGGVDSYFEPQTMKWLDRQGRVSGDHTRSAFVPSEGAGFCLLLSDTLRNRLRIAPLLHLAAVATAGEAVTMHAGGVCAGHGLTAAVRALTEGLPPSTIVDQVICDVNGERYRGEEWGFVCLRLGDRFAEPTDYISPADAWGDVGAASAPLFVMLAGQACARGYARGPRTVAWASSDSGLRGASLLVSPTEAGP